MAKCPLNNFKECYGSECEWHITKKGACAIANIADNTTDIGSISAILEYVKDVRRNLLFDK